MRVLLVSISILLSAAAAEAGGFAVREQSAYGQGASFAGMAAPGDSISAMFWNPAAITTVDRMVAEGNATAVFLDSELDVDLAASTLGGLGITDNGGNVGEIGLVPASYFAMPVTDNIFLGMSVNAPYGFGTTSDPPWVGMFSHLDAEALSIAATPVIGYKFNEIVSAAVGLQVQYFDVEIETALAPTATPPRQRLEGNSTDVGFVAGLTLTPWEGTTLGIGYRSSIKQSLKGSQTFEVPLATPLGIIPAGSYPISADVTLPETVSIGLRQRLSETFTLMAGMEWANWSRIQAVPFANSPAGTRLVLNFDDGWFFAVGGEYQVNPGWTVRLGFAYEIAPTTDEHRSMRLPDSDRIWASIGASYRWSDRLSFDAGYSHIFGKDAPVDETTGRFRYAGTVEGGADIVSVGLRYKFGG